ncbi:hypothetical protein, conserved [Eimeria acervulina]|uniref:RAP domain-containing protein n=1 Tax=Eimeria acervulina TaxID=5801 RepID=U6GT27_EIMAC|nr:hypothetical protein, conserved [Eimeria acervulina]CDI83330.1 hypothetical protein, conserved [Eimeria acervulina]
MGFFLLLPPLLLRRVFPPQHLSLAARLRCPGCCSSCSSSDSSSSSSSSSSKGFKAVLQHHNLLRDAVGVARTLTTSGAAISTAAAATATPTAETTAVPAARDQTAAESGGVAAPGIRKDAERDALTYLHSKLEDAWRLLLEASPAVQQQQQQQSLLPGSAAAVDAPVCAASAAASATAAAAAVAAGLGAGRSLLLHLKRRQQAASAAELLQQGTTSSHAFIISGSISNSNGSSGSSRCSGGGSIDAACSGKPRQLLQNCLQLLASILRNAPCYGGPAAADGGAAAAAAAAQTAAAHVEAARLAVLLLQCLLHAREEWQLPAVMLLQHIQAAADCIEAAATAQLHLQQQHQQQQQQQHQQPVEKQTHPVGWIYQQQIELAVLLKRFVRLLAALLNHTAIFLKQQQHQLPLQLPVLQQQGCRAQEKEELYRSRQRQRQWLLQQELSQAQQQLQHQRHREQLQDNVATAAKCEDRSVAAAAASPLKASAAASAALSSVRRFMETATCLVQQSLEQHQLQLHQQYHNQQQQQQQLHQGHNGQAAFKFSRPPVEEPQKFAAVANVGFLSPKTRSALPQAVAAAAGAAATAPETVAVAVAELRHLSPLLLWLLPSVLMLAQQMKCTELDGLWGVAFLLAQQQQQQQQQEQMQHFMQQLQLPELSLLLFAATRLCAMQSAQQQQQQQQLTAGKTTAAAAAAAAAGGACKLPLQRLASWCSLRAAALLSCDTSVQTHGEAGDAAHAPLAALQQQQHQQLQQQQQRQIPRQWLRPSCILLLGLTRLLQQEQLLLSGCLFNRSVQQALSGSQIWSSNNSSSNSNSSRTHAGNKLGRSSPNISELAAAGAAFLKALNSRLVAADWLQQQQQQHQQAFEAGAQVPAQPIVAAKPEAAAATTATAGAATAADDACKREKLFFSGRDFVHLLRCFVSVRFMSELLLQKALCFLGANPPVVRRKQRQQKQQQQQQAAAAAAAGGTVEGTPLLLSPQDAGLLLWALGTAAAAAVSPQQLQHRLQCNNSFLFKITPSSSGHVPTAAPAAAAVAAAAATAAAGLSPEEQHLLRIHLRRLAKQLLSSTSLEGPGSSAARRETFVPSSSSSSSSINSSISSSSDKCADSQAIANAVWGMTCCGLLQHRLLRTYCASSSYRCGFRCSSSSKEKRQLLQAALLLRLQRARAPQAAAFVALPLAAVQRRSGFSFAAAGRQSNVSSLLRNSNRKLVLQGRSRRQIHGDTGSDYKVTNSGVRPSLLQQQVLRQLEGLLQRTATPITGTTEQGATDRAAGKQTTASSAAAAAATAQISPATVRILHEYSVRGGLQLDIALLQQQQKHKQQQQQTAAVGRRCTRCLPVRIAVEVDGPSHFLLSMHTPQDLLNEYEHTPVQVPGRGFAATSNECSNSFSSSNSSSNSNHSRRSSSSNCNNNSVFVELRSDGGTALKHRLLQLLGYRVVQICFLEWQQLKGEEQQQQLLLRQPALQQLLQGLERPRRLSALSLYNVAK